MKIKDLIKQLEKLDKEKNIFLKNFMMCNNFEIHKKYPMKILIDGINELILIM